MSNQIQLTNVIESFGPLDFDTKFVRPVNLPNANTSRNLYMQVNSVTISDRIPNVFDANPYYQFNNTRLRVKTNIEPWTTITLSPGLYYTADLIGDAINAAINSLGWWLSSTDPGLTFGSNSITDQVYILFRTGKLNPIHGTSLTLDLSRAGTDTDLAVTLGFSEATAEMAGSPLLNVSYTSNQVVKMDTQGSSCDIHSTLSSDTRRNDTLSSTLAVVPFAGKTTLSDNVWPAGGQISPTIVYTGNRSLTNVSINIKTMDNKPMLFMSGRVFISISFLG